MNRNHFTKKSNQKKIIMKTTAVSLCTVILAGATCPVYAADSDRMKDENVYVTLKDDGSVDNVYVVNEFTSKNAGKVTDYGDYSSVRNLTTDDQIDIDGDAVTMEVPKGKFYYQGNVKSAEIPWNIKIQYTLDGKAISAEDLAGKNGHLVIKIDTSENTACDTDFFENYLLQATVVLNTEKCSNITAEGATAANVGKNRQLVYNIMAGQEKEIEISVDVENFEMEAISFQGVPMSFDIDEDSVDLSSVTDQTTKLKDAVATLDDGAGELKDGASKTVTGSQSLLEGTETFANGTKTLASGGNTLKTGTESLLSGALSLNQGIDQCAEGSHSLAEGTKSLAGGLLELKTQVDQIAENASSADTKQVMAQLQQLQSSLRELSNQAGAISQLLNQEAQIIGAVEMEHQQILGNVNQQVAEVNNQITVQNQELQNSAATVNVQIDQAIASIDNSVASGAIDAGEAESLKATLNASRVDVAQKGNVSMVVMPNEDEALKQQLQAVTASAEQLSQASAGFQMAAEQLAGAGNQLSALTDMGNMIGQLQSAVTSTYEGAATLEQGSAQLDQGTQQLKTGSQSLVLGVSQVNSGTKDLVRGIQSIENGSNSLLQGTTELTTGLGSLADGTDGLKSGTEEFKDQTSDMDEQIDNEIKKMLDKIAGSDYKPVSFVSIENTDIGLVQFAIRTDAIEVAEEEKQSAVEEKETIMDKIKNLFTESN